MKCLGNPAKSLKTNVHLVNRSMFWFLITPDTSTKTLIRSKRFSLSKGPARVSELLKTHSALDRMANIKPSKPRPGAKNLV